MLDFTLDTYRVLLEAFLQAGYRVLTYEQYCDLQAEESLPERYLILRHDVDKLPQNSLRTAEIEHALGVRATYYFRVYPKQADEQQHIRNIAALGHEVGYHYEDMAIANGDVEKAYEHFTQQLTYFRQFYPVRTICMHGVPTSQWDGRDLWKHYDYKQLGIVGEPYFDVDFSEVFYLTDTGRRWDGYKVSVRDKIPQYQDQWTEQGLVYRRTQAIIRAARAEALPPRIMITTHPQRWTSQPLSWLKELLWQSIKNTIKRLFLVK